MDENIVTKLILWLKNQRTGHILEAIWPTDFILGTKVQPNKAHSMIQVPMVKVKLV